MKNDNSKLKTGFKLLAFVFNFLFLTFNSVAAALAQATGEKPGSGGGKVTGGTPPSGEGLFDLPNPLGTTSITGLLKDIIDALTLFIAPPIAVLMIIIGAFQMLSAGGDPEKFKTGKKTILYAAIGFAILLLARLIIGLVKEILGVQTTK